MENTNLLPNVSEKSDVVLVQLMKAKREMGSGVTKDSSNPFHKSKYASLAAHLEMSETVLDRHGLLMLHTPTIINDRDVLVATLHHPESGQWIMSILPLPNPKDDSQGIGASITYMRRYSINSMLGLTAEDDDGETASGRGKYQKEEKKPEPKVEPVKSAEKLDKTQIVDLALLINQLDNDNKKAFGEWVKKELKASCLQDIPKASFQLCVTSLTNKLKYLKSQEKAVV